MPGRRGGHGRGGGRAVLGALELPDLERAPGTAAMVTAVTMALCASVARSALRTRTLRAAQVRLIVGAALGGVVDVLVSYGLIAPLGPAPVPPLFGAAARAAALTLATAMISAVGLLVVAFTVVFVCLLISPPGMG